MNGLSLKNNWLKLETLRNLLIILEESIEEYTSNEQSKNRKMSTCNQLDLESHGSRPTIYAQKLPGNWCGIPQAYHQHYVELRCFTSILQGGILGIFHQDS